VLVTVLITKQGPSGVQLYTLYFKAQGELLAFQVRSTWCCTGVADVVCILTPLEFEPFVTHGMSLPVCGVLFPGLLTEDWVLSLDKCGTCPLVPRG
jgi:hypothetical protein